MAQAQQEAKLKYQVHLPEGYTETKQYPLFFALHGNGGNIQEFQAYWQPDFFLEQGFIFVYVQSSQVWWQGGYGWTQKIEVARRDLESCYQKVTQQYSVDPKMFLMGGFSGGAIASIDATMIGRLPVKGFIGLCPAAKPESFNYGAVEIATQRGAKGVLMEGAILAPVQPQEEIRQLFDKVGFPYRYYLNSGIGHWFPDDLPEKLAEAVGFILR